MSREKSGQINDKKLRGHSILYHHVDMQEQLLYFYPNSSVSIRKGLTIGTI